MKIQSNKAEDILNLNKALIIQIISALFFLISSFQLIPEQLWIEYVQDAKPFPIDGSSQNEDPTVVNLD